MKFRELSNHCKRVLEAAELAYGNKTKYCITSQKRGSGELWKIVYSVLSKSKSSIPVLFNGPEVFADKIVYFPNVC